MKDYRAFLLLSFVGIAVLVMLKGLHHSQILDNVLAHTTRTAWYGGGMLASRKTESVSSSFLRGDGTSTMAQLSREDIVSAIDHKNGKTNKPLPMPDEFFLKKENASVAVAKAVGNTNMTETPRALLLESSNNQSIDDLIILEEMDISSKNETMAALI